MKIGRRQLLTGALAATLAPALERAAPGPGDTRIIPSTGEAVPAVGLGTWITFNVGRDPALLDRSADVMAAFFDEGGGMIDSSPMYGSAQQTVGYGLQKLGHQTPVFAADKVWTTSVEGGPSQMEEARRNWGVQRFDLMQVHNLVAWEGHLDTLLRMKDEGRIRHVGITTSHGRRHGEMERIMARHPIDFVQLTYNVADREAEDRLLPLAQEKGIAVIANRPFQRGALLRRLQGEPLPPVAGELDARDWSEVVLKFILSHPALTVAIPATTSAAHVRQNKRAVRGPMPDAAMRGEIARHVDAL
ncbi:MAG: aldo/keto reductase [Minwuia sp.]|uniref:aldo/keto reductase n=1 Tax=Minwuia sp. TaxID=2493630 RepID=UPI003A839DAC